MNEIRSVIIAVTGAFFALLSPIQDFMAGMLILFAVNFVFGLLAAIFNGEKWSWRKAGMCFIYCLIFFATAASMFIVGHFMHTEEQALVCVKYVCFAAIYLFGTNIVRNWQLSTSTSLLALQQPCAPSTAQRRLHFFNSTIS